MSKSRFITLNLLDPEIKNELELIQEINHRVQIIEENTVLKEHTHDNLPILNLLSEETIGKINKIDNVPTSYMGVEKPSTDVWYKKI